MPMNPERKQKWLDALRSGEFSQCKSMLRSKGTGGYCCLGVAAEVYRRETGDGKWAPSKDTDTYTRFVPGRGRAADLDLPPVVAEWYGFSGGETSPSVLTSVDGYESNEALTNLNDDLGWDFQQIADAIENDPDL